MKELFIQVEKLKEKKVEYEAHYLAGPELKQRDLLDEAVNKLQQEAIFLFNNINLIKTCKVNPEFIAKWFT